MPKFEIRNYYSLFAEKKLDSRMQLHIIKSYDGKKAIISSACSPIIYSKYFYGQGLATFSLKETMSLNI